MPKQTQTAEEISVLCERAREEYEEELCHSEEDNQRRQEFLTLSPRVLLNLGLIQDFTQTLRIKEEPEERGVSEEEQQLPVPVPETSAVCVRSEESPFEQLVETEADGDDNNQVRSRRTNLSPNNKSAPETTVHNEDKSGPDAAVQKKHQCSVCSKSFKLKSNLQTHIRVHTGEKPYSCSSCEKAFAQKGHLNLHMRTHTGEKPFSCPTCETQFARQSALKTHMRTHTGERPYSCQTCEKTFTQISNLYTHRRTHTGEKPFACPVCDKAFAQKCTLQSHMKTH